MSVAASRRLVPWARPLWALPAASHLLDLSTASHAPVQMAPKWTSIKNPPIDVKIDREDRSHLPDLLRELKALAQQLRGHLRIEGDTVRASLRQTH